MASSLVRQASFTGGELAPFMYGRTDSSVYAHGARLIRNFLPVAHGALLNRPGTEYICATKSNGAARLVPFVFADGQTFVLEFGDLYVRFITSGGQVTSGGSPYEVTTPYAAADLARLRFAQAGDVITITHPDYQPRELQRISNTNWQLATVDFAPLAFGTAATRRPIINASGITGSILGAAVAKAKAWDATKSYEIGRFVTYGTHVYQSTAEPNLNHQPDISPAQWTDLSWSNAQTYPAGEYSFDPTDMNFYVSLKDNNLAHAPNASADWWQLATDDTRPPKEWQWVATWLWRDAHGVVYETGASPVCGSIDGGEGEKFGRYIDRPTFILLPAHPSPTGDWQAFGWNIYAGRNGLFGWIGAADAASVTFRDDGQEPDYSQQPPKGTNPFTVGSGSGGTATSWPGLAAYHQQRRVFARSDAKPQDFWGSFVSDLTRFDVNTPARDSDSYNWKLASLQLEEIRALVPLTDLVLLTGQGEWSASGSGGGPITSSSIDVRRHSQHGSSYLQPLVVGNTVLFNTAKGNYVRDFIYDFRTATRDGGDLTVYARHLFEGKTLTDWAFASVPYSVAWAVRSDGVLLSLTYDRALQVIAWAQHVTDGTFEAVCSVPEDTEDAVYVIVNRTVNGSTVRYIERFASRYVPDVTQGVFLDSALAYSGTATTTLTGLDHLEGEEVTVLADGNVGAQTYTVRSGQIDVSAEFPDGVEDAVVGLPYDCDLELLDLSPSSIKTNVKSVLKTSFEVVASRGISAGETFTTLRDAPSRAVDDDYDAAGLVTGTVDVTITGSWNQGGRACLRHSDPLPLTVVAVIREVEVGGR